MVPSSSMRTKGARPGFFLASCPLGAFSTCLASRHRVEARSIMVRPEPLARGFIRTLSATCQTASLLTICGERSRAADNSPAAGFNQGRDELPGFAA